MFSKDEILYQLNPRIQQDVNKVFLIIKDLKQEAKINPFLRIRQAELDSLREFIIKLCYLLEHKYILNRQLNGYIYAEVGKIGNSTVATRNKKYLYLAQTKDQREIRKMATQFNSFYIQEHKGNTHATLRLYPAEDSFLRTLSGISQKKSYMTLLISSESEEESIVPKLRTQSGEFNDMKKKSKKHKKGTKPSNFAIMRPPESQNASMAFVEDEQPKESFKNPFVKE
jgi:hypothetical protein